MSLSPKQPADWRAEVEAFELEPCDALNQLERFGDTSAVRAMPAAVIRSAPPVILPAMMLKDVASCSTAVVSGLSQQLIEEMNLIVPNALVSFEDLDVTLGPAVWPFLQPPARDALKQAIQERGKPLVVNSAYRTLAQQLILYNHAQSKRCGIAIAAFPGRSNHQSGLALDIQDADGWRPYLQRYGWRWAGAGDYPHFDYVRGGTRDIRGTAILAFQRLWNHHNLRDRLTEDGIYGPGTHARLNQAPIEGFGLLSNGARILRLSQPLMVGSDVRLVQTVLVEAGVETAIDGIYGPNTETAVKQFQASLGLETDGIVGPTTRQALEQYIESARVLQLTQPQLSGEDVRSLQENLSKAGFPVEPDGLYGPGTGAAVKQFQQQVGLVADGIVRESTRKALSELLNEPRVLQLTQPYQRGEDVAAIQRALLKAGFDLTIDGVYGPAMAAAVRQFQEEEALPVDGMVDAATRKQLNEFLSGPPESEKPLVYYLTKNLAHGEKLQRFLNRFPDIALKEDGYLGCATSAAFRQVTGYPLQFAVCFSNLKAEYVTLFKQCKIREDKLSGIDATLTKIKANQARYESVAVMVGIPWFFIAVIHALEAALNFEKHLHNGDPLTSKTLNVPKGRPATGVPPFTWEESALDAMNLKGFKASQDWSLASLLFRLEAYNGWGYRRYHPEVLSPYLWSGSYSYTQGKYAADGVWDPELVSQQFGAAVLLRRMVDKGLIRIDQKTPPDAVPATPPFVFYSNTKIVYGDTLQQFLNEFPGIALSVDGYPGPKTSEAFQQVTGYYLSGDPRNRPGVAARITQFFNRLRSV